MNNSTRYILPGTRLVPILLIFVLCLLPFLVTCSGSWTREDISEFMDSYLSAVRKGDSAEVARFWSGESRRNDGFWNMQTWYGQMMPFDSFSSFLHDHTYKINGQRDMGSYLLVELEWLARESAAPSSGLPDFPMRFFIIDENKKTALINPLDLITKDWDAYNSDYFVYHLSDINDYDGFLSEIDWMDDKCRELESLLGVKLNEKIHYYLARSQTECGNMIFAPPLGAYAVRPYNTVISTHTLSNAHELAHLLTSVAGIPIINLAFDEGLAVALGGTTWSTPEFASIQSRLLLDHPGYIPIDELFLMEDETFSDSAHIAYYEAGSFLRYLIDEYGIFTLMILCHETAIPERLPDVFEHVYRCSLDSMEKVWREHLLTIQLPDVEYTIPDDAAVVFSMDDPVGDDRGDGNYVYPSDTRFKKGILDLVKFEVLEDSARVWFRIKFGQLVKPVMDEKLKQKFTSGVVIAINRNETSKRYLQRFCSNVNIEEEYGFDIKINAGFCVYTFDRYYKIDFAAPNDLPENIDYKNNTMVFSLPKDFIGDPAPNWEYVVGACLMQDCAMDYHFGYVSQVEKYTGQFNVGGSKDKWICPPFMDMLLPETYDQIKLLRGYNVRQKKRAKIPMIRND